MKNRNSISKINDETRSLITIILEEMKNLERVNIYNARFSLILYIHVCIIAHNQFYFVHYRIVGMK